MKTNLLLWSLTFVTATFPYPSFAAGTATSVATLEAGLEGSADASFMFELRRFSATLKNLPPRFQRVLDRMIADDKNKNSADLNTSLFFKNSDFLPFVRSDVFLSMHKRLNWLMNDTIARKNILFNVRHQVAGKADIQAFLRKTNSRITELRGIGADDDLKYTKHNDAIAKFLDNQKSDALAVAHISSSNGYPGAIYAQMIELLQPTKAAEQTELTNLVTTLNGEPEIITITDQFFFTDAQTKEPKLLLNFTLLKFDARE